MYNIKKLNEISPCALKELNENYNMSADVENPYSKDDGKRRCRIQHPRRERERR